MTDCPAEKQVQHCEFLSCEDCHKLRDLRGRIEGYQIDLAAFGDENWRD